MTETSKMSDFRAAAQPNLTLLALTPNAGLSMQVKPTCALPDWSGVTFTLQACQNLNTAKCKLMLTARLLWRLLRNWLTKPRWQRTSSHEWTYWRTVKKKTYLPCIRNAYWPESISSTTWIQGVRLMRVSILGLIWSGLSIKIWQGHWSKTKGRCSLLCLIRLEFLTTASQCTKHIKGAVCQELLSRTRDYASLNIVRKAKQEPQSSAANESCAQ